MTVVVNTQQTAIIAASGTTGTITPTGIVAGRSLVLLLADSSGASALQTACSDTGGNTWTTPDPPRGGVTSVNNSQIFVAYVHNCVAPGTITVTGGTSTNRKIILLEITGLQNTPHNAAAENFTSASTTTPTAPSVTTTVPCFAVALVSRSGNVSPTGISAGWTASAAGKPDVAAPILRAGWQEFASAGATGTCVFTFAASATPGLGMIAFPVAASGTAFTKSVSGAVSFSGIRPVVAMQRKHPGLMNFSGAEVAHPTARRVTATFTPTGALSRQLSLVRTLTAALSSIGSTSTATAYARSLVGAALHPTGSFSTIKSVSKAVSGALTFVGSQSHQARKTLSGTLAPSGSLARVLTLLRSVTGVFAPVGAVKKTTNRRFLGVASWAGVVSTNMKTSQFFAAFRPTAAALTHGLPARTLFAGLTLTGNVARLTMRQLVASLIASGVMHTQYLPPVPIGAPGGGGYGALMDTTHFRRYRVTGAWQNVKRVKA